MCDAVVLGYTYEKKKNQICIICLLKQNRFKILVQLLSQLEAFIYCYISFYKIVWHF